MTPHWPQVQLGSLADFRNGLNYTQAARRGAGLPIIGVKDFQSRLFVEFEGLEELDPEEVDTGETVVRKNDILFVRSNGNRDLIGRSMLVATEPPRRTTHSGFTIRLRFTDKRADPRFFAYLLRGPIIRKTLSAQGGGTNINNLNQGMLGALLVPLPPEHVQKRIASLLAAYDDLIELNRRRITLSEEIPRRLFEEWFVHQRFPNHQTTAIVLAGEFRVPCGWAVSRVGDLTSVLSRGIAPKYDEAAETLVVSQKCIRDQRLSLTPARRQARLPPSEKLVRPGDVLVNSTGVGTLGRAAQAEQVPQGLTVDSHVTILRPLPEVDRDFFGLALLRLETLFERLGAGATGQTELNRSRLAEIELVVPSADLQSTFGRHARPLRALAFNLSLQNDRLVSSRDRLLPRLMSGELSVAAAEDALEAAA